MDRTTAIRLLSPVITVGVVWLARRTMTAAYRGATGHEPPSPDDLDAPVTQVLIYAGAAAAVGAIVETALQRRMVRAAVMPTTAPEGAGL